MRRRDGFTLLKAVRVVGLLVLLGLAFVIVVPPHRHDVHRARQHACLSNLRQLAMSMELYRADYGTWPDGASSPAALEAGLPAGSWGAAIYGMALNTQLFACPEKHPIADGVACNYTYNAGLAGRRSVPDAPHTALLADQRFEGFGRILYRVQVDPRSPLCRIDAVHHDGANFAYADGHVKWLPKADWRPSQWNPSW